MITVKAAGIMSTITVQVKGLDLARRRARLAAWIFKLGAIAAGCAIEIAIDDQRR